MILQAKKSSKAKEDVEEDADDGEINVAGGCLDAAEDKCINSLHIDSCLFALGYEKQVQSHKRQRLQDALCGPEIACACAHPWCSQGSD